MEYVYAPWREKFVRGEKGTGCFLCYAAKHPEKDGENHVLLRGEHTFIILNAVPYNYGHVLIAPYRHVGELEELRPEERAEMLELASLFISKIKKMEKPPRGFNLGLNIGKVAGAGVPDHLHLHVVPRWEGDTNFFTILGETRVVSFDPEQVYRELKEMLKE